MSVEHHMSREGEGLKAELCHLSNPKTGIHGASKILP